MLLITSPKVCTAEGSRSTRAESEGIPPYQRGQREATVVAERRRSRSGWGLSGRDSEQPLKASRPPAFRLLSPPFSKEGLQRNTPSIVKEKLRHIQQRPLQVLSARLPVLLQS